MKLHILYRILPVAVVAAATASPVAALLDTGTGSIQLEIQADVAYDSNIYTDSRELDDGIFTVSPMLRYVQDRGLVHLSAGLGAELARFMDFDDENYEDTVAELTLSGLHRDDAISSWSLSAGWREETDASAEVGARIERDVAHVRGDASFSVSDKTGLRFSGGYTDTDFRDTRYTDSTDLFGRADALWIYSEKLNFITGYRYRETNYGGDYVDQQTDTVIFGVEGELSPKLTGLAEIGYTWQDHGFEDYIYYSLGLDWAASQKTSWSLTGKRDNQPSVTGANSIYTDVRLTANQRFSDKISGYAYVGYGVFEREGIDPRDDDSLLAGLGLNASLDATMSVYARLSYEDRQSNSPVSDYSRLIAAVGINLLF